MTFRLELLFGTLDNLTMILTWRLQRGKERACLLEVWCWYSETFLWRFERLLHDHGKTWWWKFEIEEGKHLLKVLEHNMKILALSEPVFLVGLIRKYSPLGSVIEIKERWGRLWKILVIWRFPFDDSSWIFCPYWYTSKEKKEGENTLFCLEECEDLMPEEKEKKGFW